MKEIEDLDNINSSSQSGENLEYETHQNEKQKINEIFRNITDSKENILNSNEIYHLNPDSPRWENKEQHEYIEKCRQ